MNAKSEDLVVSILNLLVSVDNLSLSNVAILLGSVSHLYIDELLYLSKLFGEHLQIMEENQDWFMKDLLTMKGLNPH